MLPAVLSARAVRRVHCSRCGERFEADSVAEVGAGGRIHRAVARLRGVGLPSFDPSGRAWQIASVPVAAVLVIGGLMLIQRGGDDPAPRATAPPASEAAGDAAPLTELPGEQGRRGGAARNAAEIVRGSHYSLAMPAGWEKVDPPTGATFAAVAGDGSAEATLWIEDDANLDFPAFIAQSLRQLETLAPNPRVIERVPGPTPETTRVSLAATSPPGQPRYEVLLRAAGPYRYYLAFTLQPDAGREAADGADLLANSFTPEVRG